MIKLDFFYKEHLNFPVFSYHDQMLFPHFIYKERLFLPNFKIEYISDELQVVTLGILDPISLGKLDSYKLREGVKER